MQEDAPSDPADDGGTVPVVTLVAVGTTENSAAPTFLFRVVMRRPGDAARAGGPEFGLDPLRDYPDLFFSLL